MTSSSSSSGLPEKQEQTQKQKSLSLKDRYPEIYAQTNIDRRGCKRIVPMEILSLGMGRTGTMCKFIAFCFIFSISLCCVESFGA
jgi:hypothetical protein